MKKWIFFFGLAFLFVQCKSIEPQPTREQTKLAFELCQLFGADQGAREKALSQHSRQILPVLDSINFGKFVEFVRINGMPTEALVGKSNYQEECVKGAAFSILLHNPEKLVNQQVYSDLFLREVELGRMKPEFFALVIDKYAWARGLPLPYGGSFGQPCLAEQEQVNARRKALGLKALEAAEFKSCD